MQLLRPMQARTCRPRTQSPPIQVRKPVQWLWATAGHRSRPGQRCSRQLPAGKKMPPRHRGRDGWGGSVNLMRQTGLSYRGSQLCRQSVSWIWIVLRIELIRGYLPANSCTKCYSGIERDAPRFPIINTLRGCMQLGSNICRAVLVDNGCDVHGRQYYTLCLVIANTLCSTPLVY